MRIRLSHGSGGSGTWELIRNIFAKKFRMENLEDAVYLDINGKVAMSTDSFVVDPVVFPGGDLGKLSICGTANDLAVSGARPLYISAGFVLEEGLELGLLERIAASMAREAEENGIRVVCGDTKVVEGRGRLFVNTTGVGVVERTFSAASVRPGDAVVVTGTLGEHAMAVFVAREKLDLDVSIESDCANLYPLLKRIYGFRSLRWMRDLTRGGLATALLELSEVTGLGAVIYEERIPVREDVLFLCESFGFDPLYLACEGRAVLVVGRQELDGVLAVLKEHELGRKASFVGEIVEEKGVFLITDLGGKRRLDYLEEDPIPRIC